MTGVYVAFKTHPCTKAPLSDSQNSSPRTGEDPREKYFIRKISISKFYGNNDWLARNETTFDLLIEILLG